MAQNLNCPCLCHGSDGNRIGDKYFSCGGCYAAYHMGALPREQQHEPKAKAKAKGPRKDKVVKKVTPEQVAKGLKAATAGIGDVADAVENIGKKLAVAADTMSRLAEAAAAAKKNG